VVFTTAEEDAKRRDFTINGMFYDPIEERVIDYVGGQEDLRNKILRAIGNPDERFEEDHLRMLRAVRFAARFELKMEPATGEAIKRHAEHLKRISPERIAEELRLMLGDGSRCRAWPLLWGLGLVDVIFRHLPAGNPSPLAAERSIVSALSPDEPMELGEPLAAAVLCYQWQRGNGGDIRRFLGRDAARAAANAMRKALKISNEEYDQVRSILEWLGALLSAPPPTLALKKRFLAQPHSPAAMEVMEAIASVGEQASLIWPLWEELTQLQTTDFNPPPLMTGDDLTAAGLKPGPVFKRVLDAVYDAQLEDRVRTKDEALQLALKLARISC
jgi:poly(A) polymerase